MVCVNKPHVCRGRTCQKMGDLKELRAKTSAHSCSPYKFWARLPSYQLSKGSIFTHKVVWPVHTVPLSGCLTLHVDCTASTKNLLLERTNQEIPPPGRSNRLPSKPLLHQRTWKSTDYCWAFGRHCCGASAANNFLTVNFIEMIDFCFRHKPHDDF